MHPNRDDKSHEMPNSGNRVSRRDILKTLGALPVFGAFAFGILKKKVLEQKEREILRPSSSSEPAPVVAPKTTMHKSGELIRLGIIGVGRRGETLARAAGFAHPDWIEKRKKGAAKEKMATRLEDWLNQEDLNVALTGVCDVFDLRAERGVAASQNSLRPGGSSGGLPGATRYRHYQELLQSNEIDAVIIATPDHQHARMAIDALNAGKHVYCEKCMTRTEAEVYQVAAAVRNSGMVFQVGHQFSQSANFVKAKEIIENNILGKITLVETTSNRNTSHGAWVRHLDKKGNPRPGSPQTIDWQQWLGSSPKVPFSLDRYYNWTKWFDYGTGVVGQLFSHEFDSVNQLLGIGIPCSVVASGGIYFHKDNRDIPDTFHAVFEYPDRELTILYSATLANSRPRGRVFMGHDASMEVGDTLRVIADQYSTRYREKIASGRINPSLPLFSSQAGPKGMDAVTSATEKYYADRGLLFTHQEGRRVDMAHLHIKNWLDVIRNGGTPACGIDRGFEVTLTCHMATKAYLEQRRVEWDPINKRIV